MKARDPACPICGYNLRMHVTDTAVRCPECGSELAGRTLAPKGFRNRYVWPYFVRWKSLLLAIALPPLAFLGMLAIGYYAWSYEVLYWPVWYKLLLWSAPLMTAAAHVLLAHRYAGQGRSTHAWRAAAVMGPFLTTTSICIYFMYVHLIGLTIMFLFDL